jgi:hypothetical protein
LTDHRFFAALRRSVELLEQEKHHRKQTGDRKDAQNSQRPRQSGPGEMAVGHGVAPAADPKAMRGSYR